MGWLDQFRQENKDSEIQVKPEDFKKLTSIPDDFDKKFDTLVEQQRTQATVLERMGAYFEAQSAKELQKEQAAREAEAKRKQQEESSKPLDFENDFDGSLKRVLGPISENQLRISARDLRREILVEDPEFAEHYTGELKARVDKILDAEPLANQNAPELIRNAYKSVAYDMRKEIEEGKIRSKFAATGARASGTGATSASSTQGTTTELTADEKMFISKMGITADAYAKSKKELGYV